MLYLIFATSATALGDWHDSKPAHHLKRADGGASDASQACGEIKSQISSASEVIDGASKCCASRGKRPANQN